MLGQILAKTRKETTFKRAMSSHFQFVINSLFCGVKFILPMTYTLRLLILPQSFKYVSPF